MALMLAACGKSECQEFATVYCTKASSCGYQQGGLTVHPAQSACEEQALEYWDSIDVTEGLCKSEKAKVAPMTCPQFQAYAAGE